MRYKNMKTGAVIDSSFIISGDDWVRSIELKAQQTGIIEIPENQETNETEEENNQTAENQNAVKNDIPENTSSTDLEEITKAQIMQELGAFGIEYNKRDKKEVLYDLMMQHGK